MLFKHILFSRVYNLTYKALKCPTRGSNNLHLLGQGYTGDGGEGCSVRQAAAWHR